MGPNHRHWITSVCYFRHGTLSKKGQRAIELKEGSNKTQLYAKDSSKKVFRYFCIACWLAWIAVALLTAWALFVLRSDYVPFTRDDVLGGFGWITFFCLGMPLVLKIFLLWVEKQR